jgi:putative tributyrin esterase
MSPPFRTFGVSDPRFEHEGLRHVTVKSPALRARGDISVWLPQDVDIRSQLPIAILLHGVYGSHWNWALNGGAHRTAARLIAEGAIRPMALAMPSDGLWGDGSGYVEHRHADFERWIGDDVPAAARMLLSDKLRARSPLLLCGLSMGGFGALRIAARYGREQFTAVSAHSSITHFRQMSAFVEEPLLTYGVGAEGESVFKAILAHRQHLPAIRFDCGMSDPLIEPNRELHRALTEIGVTHVYEEFPGGHEWAYWEEHLADSLRFFEAVLRG